MKPRVKWAVGHLLCVILRIDALTTNVEMGVTHAWELDNEPPIIQTAGKGLGGGSAIS